jgi:hypothetical protein
MIPQPPGASIAKRAERFPKFTVSLRDFYDTFMTSLPASVILSSVTADNAWSSEFVTVVAPGVTVVGLVKHRG